MVNQRDTKEYTYRSEPILQRHTEDNPLTQFLLILSFPIPIRGLTEGDNNWWKVGQNYRDSANFWWHDINYGCSRLSLNRVGIESAYLEHLSGIICLFHVECLIPKALQLTFIHLLLLQNSHGFLFYHVLTWSFPHLLQLIFALHEIRLQIHQT